MPGPKQRESEIRRGGSSLKSVENEFSSRLNDWTIVEQTEFRTISNKVRLSVGIQAGALKVLEYARPVALN
jgi:hypothetical protein